MTTRQVHSVPYCVICLQCPSPSVSLGALPTAKWAVLSQPPANINLWRENRKLMEGTRHRQGQARCVDGGPGRAQANPSQQPPSRRSLSPSVDRGKEVRTQVGDVADEL